MVNGQIYKVLNESIASKQKMLAQNWNQLQKLVNFNTLTIDNMSYSPPIQLIESDNKIVTPSTITVRQGIDWFNLPEHKQMFSNVDLSRSFYEFMSKLESKMPEIATLVFSSFRIATEIIKEQQADLKHLDEVDEIMVESEDKIKQLQKKIDNVEKAIKELKSDEMDKKKVSEDFTELFVEFQEKLFQKIGVPFDKTDVIQKIKGLLNDEVEEIKEEPEEKSESPNYGKLTDEEKRLLKEAEEKEKKK